MNLKKTIQCTLCLVMVLYINITTSQNLLDTSTWIEGSGSVAGFTQYGTTSENSREYHYGPIGRSFPLVWKV